MSQTKRLPAKVAYPILVSYHPRLRLYELLDEYQHHPVTWVSAPAGSGKTTLMASYLKDRSLKSLWYRVDETDADPATFFSYMRQAAKGISPRKKKCLPLLTPEYQPNLLHFANRYFEQLFECMPAGSVLVLDNYHNVPEDSIFHSVMSLGLSLIPDGIRVVLVSRNEPPAKLIRLEANRNMAVLTWADLRLGTEEIAGIMDIMGQTALEQEKLEELHKLSGGWTAGVVLMVLQARNEGVKALTLRKQTNETIFDYFACEVFEKLDQPTKDFLIKTAYLSNMSIPMAESLTGNASASRIINYLIRHNYFVECRQHSHLMYSYHPLFKQFLQELSRQQYSKDELVNLITHAAKLLEDDGQVDEALELMQGVGDWDTLTMFLLQHGKTMLGQGRHKTLEHWLTQVPGEILNVSPWLLYWLGMSRLPFEPPLSMTHLEEAYRRFKEQHNMQGFFLSWAGMANIIAFGFVGIERVAGLIKDLEEKRAIFNSLQSEEIKSLVASGMVGILGNRITENPDIETWFDLALDLAHRTGDTDALIRVYIGRTAHCVIVGNVNMAAKEVKSLEMDIKDKPVSELGQLLIEVIKTLFYEHANLHEQCIYAAEHSLQLAKASGIHLLDVYPICHAAMSCMNVSDIDTAAHYIDLLTPYIDRNSSFVEKNISQFLKCFIYLTKTRYALINGNFEEAQSYADEALRSSMKDTISFGICLSSLFKAIILHKLRKYGQAHDFLSQAAPYCALLNNDGWFIAPFLEAELAFDQGQYERGLSLLQEYLPRTRMRGYYGPAFDIPSSTAKLCAHALEAGIEVDYVKEIISRRNYMPDNHALVLESWPWPVKIYTLGRFQIIRYGESITFGRKAQIKPLELLQILVARNGHSVSDVYVADLLWPEADGDLAMNSLSTTLHRLRKLLGRGDALEVKNRQISLDPRLCWVDSQAFCRVLDRSYALWEKALSEKDREEACRVTCSALDLFKGDFLPDEFVNPDVLSLREQLKQKYFRELFHICDHMESCGKTDKLRMYLERGLALDDCSEESYQRLMGCLQKQDRSAEALAVFERCRKMLEIKLGASPSVRTEKMARSLRTRKNL